MSEVQQLGPRFFGDGDMRGFPSLEFLELSWLENWKEWRMCLDDHPNTQIFSRLQCLRVYECPKLKSIPFQIPSTVRVINLERCPNLKILPSWLEDVTCLEELIIDGIGDVELSLCYDNLKSLQTLIFSDLAELVSLDLSYLINLIELNLSDLTELVSLDLSYLINLRWLNLSDLTKLVSLDLSYLINLRGLVISSCPKLSVISMVVKSPQLEEFRIKKASQRQLKKWLMFLSSNTNTSSELQRLFIEDCPELMSFDADMDEALHKLTNLSKLGLGDCCNLVCFPENGLSSSLQILWIYKCPLLEERCKEGGADWHKIEHIPYISFS